MAGPPKRKPAAERRAEALATLGVEEGADEEVIRKAYKKLALKHHPDKNGAWRGRRKGGRTVSPRPPRPLACPPALALLPSRRG